MILELKDSSQLANGFPGPFFLDIDPADDCFRVCLSPSCSLPLFQRTFRVQASTTWNGKCEIAGALIGSMLCLEHGFEQFLIVIDKHYCQQYDSSRKSFHDGSVRFLVLCQENAF